MYLPLLFDEYSPFLYHYIYLSYEYNSNNLSYLIYSYHYPTLANAQNIQWNNVSEQFSLPEGVQLFEGTDPTPHLKLGILKWI